MPRARYCQVNAWRGSLEVCCQVPPPRSLLGNVNWNRAERFA